MNNSMNKIITKVKDHMFLGSIYDNIMMKTKYDTPLLSQKYNVLIGQKHRMLYYKKLEKMFWNDCTANRYWEKAEKKVNKNTVWFCWLQGIENAPIIVKRCLESLRKNMVGKEIIVIDEHNLNDYIQLPDYIMKKWKTGKFGAAHFTDLIRLELLIRYGGYWIDATVLCTDTKILKYIEDQPLFMYSFYFFNFSAEIMKANTWFIYANTNQNVLCLTREFLYQYWKKYDRLVEYFLIHLFLTMALEYYKEEAANMPVIGQVDAHILAKSISEPFNPKKLELLKMQSDFHKLSHKFAKERLELRGTFYDTLIRKGEFI